MGTTVETKRMTLDRCVDCGALYSKGRIGWVRVSEGEDLEGGCACVNCEPIEYAPVPSTETRKFLLAQLRIRIERNSHWQCLYSDAARAFAELSQAWSGKP